MTVCNCTGQLLDELANLCFIKLFRKVERQVVEKTHASNILHDEIDVFMVVVALDVLNDVWVIEFPQDCYFVNHHLQVILQFLFVYRLNGNHSVVVVDRL